MDRELAFLQKRWVTYHLYKRTLASPIVKLMIQMMLSPAVLCGMNLLRHKASRITMEHGHKWEDGQEKNMKSSLNVSIIALLPNILYFIALRLFGKDWQSVQRFIKTRSSAQIRSHA